jgi:hypothetical protein
MTQQQRMLMFYAAIAAAVILAIIGVLYLAGDFVPSGRHVKHALLAFVLAVGALVVANFNRPSIALR